MFKTIKKYYPFIIFLLIIFSCNHTEIINKEEKQWLIKHPDLVIGLCSNSPPYQYINEKGEVSGIFVDFIKIIEHKLNYQFKKTYQSDFSNILAEARSGVVDIIPEIQSTEQRLEYLNFTPTLISHNHIIVVRKSVTDIKNIDDLRTKNIVVVNKYAIQEYLLKKYPEYKVTPLFNNVVCLQTVSTGQADAFICQQAVATYFIEKEGISNLKIIGEVTKLSEL